MTAKEMAAACGWELLAGGGGEKKVGGEPGSQCPPLERNKRRAFFID